MSDINTAPEELDATANGSVTVEADTPAPTADAPPTEAKTISLDDALAQAFEKHTPKGDEPASKGALPAALPGAPAVADTDKPVDPITGRVSEPMKAPAGWTPTLREKWGGIDPTVQKFIHDREKDMAQTISKTADERKVANEFKALVAPYETTIRQFNIPATQLTGDLLKQWHGLHTGTPVAKAQMIDQFIRFFKPDIPTLIALSNGQQPSPSQAPAPVDVDQLVEQKFAAREQAAQEAAIDSDIQKFESDPANEFFPDVRDAMGRIIAADLVSGDSMSEVFKKAYDLACSQHPEISKVMAQRTAAAPAVVHVPAHTRSPVGSVKPSLGSGNKSKPAARKMSLDDAVAEAFRVHQS